MALKDFDRRLVSLIAEALDAAQNKEELGSICYHLTRAACYLHSQEFGTDNGQRLMGHVSTKIFDEMSDGKADDKVEDKDSEKTDSEKSDPAK
ncbi:MAG: hypothetical protein JKY20_11245 [Alphaproteobacteria bacterium]|nr:hypothetical protein [Alphaproteobacteria bacterium]